MNWLLQIDRDFFLFINKGLSNPVFDAVMPFIRNPMSWAPMFVFLFAYMIINHRKNFWWWIGFALATAALGDLISSQLLKEIVYRVRPCHEPSLADNINFLLNYRPRSSSFPSSHAFTHFALANFFYLTLRKIAGRNALFFFLWASLVAFAQVYVGVHYPFDVIGGALLGTLLGLAMGTLFCKKLSFA